MKKYSFLIVLIFCWISFVVNAQQKIAVGFYNLENLFDTIDNPHKDDDDFTPKGSYQWNTKRYFAKVEKIGEVLANIEKITQMPLVTMGFCEVENEDVLYALTRSSALKQNKYGVVIYPSSDNRGLGTAFLYRRDIYKPYHDTVYKVTDPSDAKFATRDQLLISGVIGNDTLHFITIHYPSRRSGKSASEHKRILAANVTRKIVDDLKQTYRNPKIIIFGDFNDTPTDKSVTVTLKADKELTDNTQLWNTSYALAKKGYGTLAFQSSWYLFDQIIISKPLINSKKGYAYLSTHIFSSEKLTTSRGKLVGIPLRTFEGRKYTGGYSDHFPVYIVLSK